MLIKVEIDLALEKKRKELEVAKAKEEFAKVEKKVGEKAMESYKASIKFVAKKAWAMEIFQISKEF